MIYRSNIDWSFVDSYRDMLPPFGAIGYITYKRTYARMTESGVTEEWWQTIARAVRGLVDDLDMWIDQETIELLYHYIFTLKINLSGRSLWQLGTDTVRKVGADSLQNCWTVPIDSEIKPFTFTMNQLMLGGGVGFVLTPEMVYGLPKVKHSPSILRMDQNDVDFIIPDNREGWVKLLDKTLNAFYHTGKDLTYSTTAIRPKGARINGFGGIASGPEELAKGIHSISTILGNRYGEKIRPIDALDIMNIIGSIVVAGNVRRSAQIAIGSPHDKAFLDSKAWGRHRLPSWRQMSNNTCVSDDLRELPKHFWDNFTERDSNGNAVSECFGLFNQYNAQRYGRISDGHGYRDDPHVIGLNPCGEITLEGYEACNLTEIYLPNIEDEDEFRIAAKLCYMVGKTISKYPFSDPVVNAVVQRNHRLGISVTGFLQAPHLKDEGLFTRVYRSLEAIDVEYSKILGITESVKLTTVKPSGTLSLLPGVTPGVHPAFAEYYKRRIRFSATDPLVDICLQHGFSVEPAINIDGSKNLDTMVVTFVDKTTALTAHDVSAVKQLEYQKWLQTYWSDNAVSCTVYFKDEEIPEIKQFLDVNYNENMKSTSMLRHSGHGYIQAPYEEITRDEYYRIKSITTPIVRLTETSIRDLDSVECSTGMCPIR